MKYLNPVKISKEQSLLIIIKSVGKEVFKSKPIDYHIICGQSGADEISKSINEEKLTKHVQICESCMRDYDHIKTEFDKALYKFMNTYEAFKSDPEIELILRIINKKVIQIFETEDIEAVIERKKLKLPKKPTVVDKAIKEYENVYWKDLRRSTGLLYSEDKTFKYIAKYVKNKGNVISRVISIYHNDNYIGTLEDCILPGRRKTLHLPGDQNKGTMKINGKHQIIESLYTHDRQQCVPEHRRRWIKRGRKAKTFKDTWITLDIETIQDNEGNQTIASIQSYNPKIGTTFFTLVDRSKVVNEDEYEHIHRDVEAVKKWLDHIVEEINSMKLTKMAIYCHNFGGFDSRFLLIPIYKILESVGKKMTIKNHNNKTMSVTFKYKDINLEIRDSLKLLPYSLKLLCKMYNVEHVKYEFPHRFLWEKGIDYVGEPPSKEYFEGEYPEFSENYIWNMQNELKKYGINDCIALHEVIHKFAKITFEQDHINVLDCISAPALAKKVFLTNYYNPWETPLYTPYHSHDKLLRKTYFGGRTEVFNLIHKGTFHKADIVSAYPSIMRMELPMGDGVLVLDYSPNKLEKELKCGGYKGFLFARVRITIPKKKHNNSNIGPLPHIDKETERLEFPTGTFDGHFVKPELEYAIKYRGAKINKIYWLYHYEQTGYILKNFIDSTFTKRLEEKLKIKNLTGDEKNIAEAKSLYYKLIMNSLYGKFGQKQFHNTTIILPTRFIGKYSQLIDNIKEIKGFISKDELDKAMRNLGNPENIFTNLGLVMVELNGKILAHLRKYLPRDEVGGIDIEILEITKDDLLPLIKDLNEEQILDMMGYNPQTNISIASAITSYARVTLLKYMEKIEEKGGKVIYGDTDSLFYTTRDGKKIKDSIFTEYGELGKLEHEEGQFRNFICPSTKMYIYEKYNEKTGQWEEIKKHKGITIKAAKQLTKESYNDIINKKPIHIKTEMWFQNITRGGITVKELYKEIKNIDTKRKHYLRNGKWISKAHNLIDGIKDKHSHPPT